MTRNSASFTEANYAEILRKASAKYRFNGSDLSGNQPVVCWRHDIDYSPHRALAMARLEAEMGLRCVYHILPSSRYYNILEPEITEILCSIAALGHEIGLHFDPDVMGSDAVPLAAILKRIEIERLLLHSTLECDIRSFSLHNHTLHLGLSLSQPEIAGMRNLASPDFYDQAKYISDSNGIWRKGSLDEVIDAPAVPKLHVLTHAIWWTPEAMTPYEKFLRVINGRMKSNRNLYLQTMQRDGRLDTIGERIGVFADHLVEAGMESKVVSNDG